MSAQRTLIIGAGKRVQEMILPALLGLKDQYQIAHVCSRTQKTIEVLQQQFTTITNIHSVRFDDIDVVILSVPHRKAHDVLAQLCTYKVNHVRLFIDTPVFSLRHLQATKLFSQFRSVRVLEDYIAMIHYEYIRKQIQNDIIGRVRYIYFFHNGYKYHAIATIKRILSEFYVASVRVHKRASGIQEVHMRFPGGTRALILEPREYSVGRFLIVGDRGYISDYPLSGDVGTCIEYVTRSGIFSGIRVHKRKSRFVAIPIKHRRVLSVLRQYSTLMSIKIDALMHMFSNESMFTYSSFDGLYDFYVSETVDERGSFYDIKLPFLRMSLMQLLLRARAMI